MSFFRDDTYRYVNDERAVFSRKDRSAKKQSADREFAFLLREEECNKSRKSRRIKIKIMNAVLGNKCIKLSRARAMQMETQRIYARRLFTFPVSSRYKSGGKSTTHNSRKCKFPFHRLEKNL